MLTVTALYAGLLALLLIGLCARVILYRGSNDILLGDAGDPDLLRRMRVQANCAEYVPLGILLLAIAELNAAPGLALHVLGLMLLAGRVIHVLGFGRNPEILPLRIIGTGLTLLMLGATALGLIAHSLL